jgi:hypothetical protein
MLHFALFSAVILYVGWFAAQGFNKPLFITAAPAVTTEMAEETESPAPAQQQAAREPQPPAETPKGTMATDVPRDEQPQPQSEPQKQPQFTDLRKLITQLAQEREKRIARKAQELADWGKQRAQETDRKCAALRNNHAALINQFYQVASCDQYGNVLGKDLSTVIREIAQREGIIDLLGEKKRKYPPEYNALAAFLKQSLAERQTAAVAGGGQ